MHRDDGEGGPGGSKGVHLEGNNDEVEVEEVAAMGDADDDATAVTAMASAPLGREVVDERDARDLLHALMKG